MEKGTNISNNTFIGVKFDEKATQVLQTVADALLNLTRIFRAQNIEIEALLKMEGDKTVLSLGNDDKKEPEN